MIREKKLDPLPGAVMLFVLLAASGGGMWTMAAFNRSPPMVLLGGLGMTVALIALIGLQVVNPNDARVLTVFGTYTGTVREPGFWWVNPFSNKRLISLRARSFESTKLKVNDKEGSPVEIGAIIVWRVADTAEALFNVENFERYVAVQAEAALRSLASHYPYDGHDDPDVISLRGSMAQVAAKLKEEVETALRQAGIEVVDARISHLAYAPEIAQAMLQRQQASAIIAARSRIVEGAVSMVEMAINKLESKHIVELDGERKAAMVSNLLVVLCGERHTQPVINAGTLYTG